MVKKVTTHLKGDPCKSDFVPDTKVSFHFPAFVYHLTNTHAIIRQLCTLLRTVEQIMIHGWQWPTISNCGTLMLEDLISQSQCYLK